MKIKFFTKALVLSIIFIGISVFIFFFLLKQINRKNENAEVALLQWSTENSRRQGIKDLNNSIKDIENEKILLDSHFVPVSDVVPFLDMIEGFGSRLNVKSEITSVDVSTDNNLLVGVRANSGFESLVKYLMLLENSPYEMDFDYMDIRQMSDKDLSWELDLKIRLLSFIQ